MNSTITAKNALHHLDRLDIEIGIIEEYKRLGAFDLFKDRLEINFIQKFYLNTIFIIFTRFNYIPDIFNFMKKTVLEFFPDYNNNREIENINEREKLLLRLLDIDGEISLDELYRVKMAYLASFS